MIKLRYLALVAVGLTATSCKGDYLTGGDLSNDPNRPQVATASQLFAGAESAIWAGIHFRSDLEAGIAIGESIARLLIDRIRTDG